MYNLTTIHLSTLFGPVQQVAEIKLEPDFWNYCHFFSNVLLRTWQFNTVGFFCDRIFRKFLLSDFHRNDLGSVRVLSWNSTEFNARILRKSGRLKMGHVCRLDVLIFLMDNQLETRGNLKATPEDRTLFILCPSFLKTYSCNTNLHLNKLKDVGVPSWYFVDFNGEIRESPMWWNDARL